MDIVLIGVNHKTAPVELRERLAFSEAAIPEALSNLVDHGVLEEGLIVSTCNRIELLATAPSGMEPGLALLAEFLCGFHKLSANELDGHLYRWSGSDAIKHVFRVASSLDSMVVGEPQILGQVKDAYHQAVEAGTIGRVLSQLMDRAISVAKRVRNETGISQNPVSVSSVAVELGCKIFGSLSGKTILLVGAGEMAELAARSLLESGSSHESGESRLIVTSRTADHAESIARKFGGAAVSFEAFYDVLPSADIVICSTGAPDYVIKYSEVGRALNSRRKGPILFIDISVPRNIDPKVGEVENAFIFDIDDLQSVVQANLREREREAQAAETIVESEVQHFLAHLRSLDIGPSIVELKRVIQEIALSELKRNRKHLGAFSPEQEAALREVLIPALVNKLSHPIIVHMRAAARNGETASVLDELRKMIRIE